MIIASVTLVIPDGFFYAMGSVGIWLIYLGLCEWRKGQRR